MPRSIEVSGSPETIDALLRRLKAVEGVVGLARQSGASLVPPGDVLSIQTTTDASRSVVSILEELEVKRHGSFKTSEVMSLVSSEHQPLLDDETNETIWDEMAFLLRQDTNLSPNYLMAMTLCGAIAAGGLWTDTLHLVVGAMLVAPAFEPLVRAPFGFISGAARLISSGIKATLIGYALLALGAALTTLVLGLGDWGPAAALSEQQWVRYWSSVTLPSVLVSAFGGAAGAVIISGHRSVLTTGVMVTLALIPSMALVGMGISIGNFSLAGQGLVRWAVDAILVIAMSGLVFAVKKRLSHQRRRALS